MDDESRDMALVQYDYHEEADDEELHHLRQEGYELHEVIIDEPDEQQLIITQAEDDELEQLGETEQVMFLEMVE